MDHIDSLGSLENVEAYIEKFLFFQERLPKAEPRTIRYIIENYPDDADEYMDRFQFLQNLLPDADLERIHTIIETYDVVDA